MLLPTDASDGAGNALVVAEMQLLPFAESGRYASL